MTHSPTCSGCPLCNRWCAVAHNLVSAGEYREYCTMIAADNNRRGPMRAAQLRTNIHEPKDDDDEPRRKEMADFRRALVEQARLAALDVPRSTSDVHLNPPDPYVEALKKRKQQ